MGSLCPILRIPLAETNDFYIDGRVSRRRIHQCKNCSSPPRESQGKEGNCSDVRNLFPLLSSGFPWRRRTTFTSMDPPPRDASIDVKTIRLRQGNLEEWTKRAHSSSPSRAPSIQRYVTPLKRDVTLDLYVNGQDLEWPWLCLAKRNCTA